MLSRYNWIEYGNRQIDLVDSDYPEIYNDPSYRKTFVYRNILIEQYDVGNSQIVHYGGDSGDTTHYRHGVLYFYNNTIISKRTGNTTTFRLSTNLESCDARNNIFYVIADGSKLALIADYGNLIVRNNWLKTGWIISHSNFQGTFVDSGGLVEGIEPGFVDFVNEDFHLLDTSSCVNTGSPLAPAVLPEHNVIYQYVKHSYYEPRPYDGVFDIGAYEYYLTFIDEIPNNMLKVTGKTIPTIIKDKIILPIPVVFHTPVILYIYEKSGRKIIKIPVQDKVLDLKKLNLSSGTYFIRLESGNFKKIGKIIFIR